MTNLKVERITGLNKIKGLINSQSARPVLIRTRFGIHTFGLKFNIDILVLDNENAVVKLIEGIKPNRIFIWNPFFDKVIELSAGTIKKNKIKLGTQLVIHE